MKYHIPSLIALSLLLGACGTPGDTVSSRTPKGDPQAPVTVTEYADLQCPACGSAYPLITTPLIEQYGNRIRYDFMHFPLRSLHRYALDAAEAAECAADQGKFWEYIDLVYTNQKDLDNEHLLTWAEDLKLDMTTLKSCTASHRKRDVILAEYDEGRAKGVQGTPTFFVNGKQVEATLTALKEAIDSALGQMQQQL